MGGRVREGELPRHAKKRRPPIGRPESREETP
jgi:hypothetical protein